MDYKYKNIISFSIFSTIIFALTICFQYGYIINNGDYYRTFNAFGIEITPFQEHNDLIFSFNLDNISLVDRLIPRSSLRMIMLFFLNILDILGIQTFNFLYLKIFLYAIFTIGIVLLFLKNRNITLLFSILLTTLAFGFLLNSAYQEAVAFSLMPLLLWSLTQEKITKFLIIAFFILFCKSQMIFFLPIFIFIISTWKNITKQKKIIFSLSLSCLSLIFNINQGKFFKEINAYNRFYSGIGYSIQNVENWENITNFHTRAEYFKKHQDSLQKISNPYFEQEELKTLLGTSYWPKGKEIFESENSNKNGIFQQGNYTNFILFFFKNPSLFFKVPYSSTITALKSDLSLDYLRPKNFENSFYHQVSLFLGNKILGIMIFFLSLLIIFRFNIKNLAFYIIFVIGAATFTVIGDGYYEFEKHLIPYLMMFPLFVFLIKPTFSKIFFTCKKK